MRKKRVAAKDNEVLTTFARTVGSAVGTIVSKASRVMDAAGRKAGRKYIPAKSKKAKAGKARSTKKRTAKKVSRPKAKTSPAKRKG